MGIYTIDLNDLCPSCRRLPYENTGLTVEEAFNVIPNHPGITGPVNRNLAAMLHSAIVNGNGCDRCRHTVMDWAIYYLR